MTSNQLLIRLCLLLPAFPITCIFAQKEFSQADTIRNFSSYQRSLSFAGLIQTRYVGSLNRNVDIDGRHFDNTASNPIRNSFLMKRVRLQVKANVNDHFSANIMTNFAEFNSDPTHKVLENAYIKYTLNKHFNVQAGQFRPFMGVEDVVPVDLIRTLDYSNQYYAFGASGWQSFQTGVSVFGDITGEKQIPIRYYAGIYNGNNRNQPSDNDNTKNLYTRLEISPAKTYTIGVNGATGSLGDGTGHALGVDLAGRFSLSPGWYLLLSAEYKTGTNFVLYKSLPVPRPSISGTQMRGFYIFPILRYEYQHPRVRAIEFSTRYEYFNEDYKGQDNPRQTLIPNLSLIFADAFYAALQLGASIDMFRRDIPLTTTYSHSLIYAQLQVRF